MPFWGVGQCILSPLLLVLCVREYLYGNRQVRKALVARGGLLLAICMDLTTIFDTAFSALNCTKFVFFITFTGYLVATARRIILDNSAYNYAKKLEKELTEQRIAIMLSQIQPHFLYNSLGAIRELCRQDPEDARHALSTFITYLRGNMDSIQREHTIHFSKELNHISAYLELEKLRFGDDLNIVYDIQETEFSVPSLTIQPLVENAVKHGVCGREEGGTLTLHTHREGDAVVIKIQDDGVGFDVDKIEQFEHVGLKNVRKRLQYTINGELKIESKPDIGTTATITIHDRKDWDR